MSPIVSGGHGSRTRNRQSRHLISNPGTTSPNDQSYRDLRHDATTEVPPLVPCPPEVEKSPQLPDDLAHLLAGWYQLPQAIRTGILVIVNAAGSTLL